MELVVMVTVVLVGQMKQMALTLPLIQVQVVVAAEKLRLQIEMVELAALDLWR